MQLPRCKLSPQTTLAGDVCTTFRTLRTATVKRVRGTPQASTVFGDAGYDIRMTQVQPRDLYYKA